MFKQTDDWRHMRLNQSMEALNKAIEIVARRESNYRVPVERIAGWRGKKY